MWVPFLPEPDQAKNFAWLLLFVFFPGLICGQSELPEWLDGNFTLELQHFPGDAQDPRQENQNASIKLEFDFDNEWAGELRKVLYFSPFYRIDRSDKERTHFDLREFNLLTVGDSWDLRVGISKVFWGATEFVHWVDVINQTDFVENIDGEEKLGQPMVQFSIDREEGKFELYYLPYFRERTFPGVEGRPRIIPHVDPDQAKFENADAEQHPDFALRWSESFDDADVGLSHFYGTTREPTYLEGFDNGEPVLIPYYEIISQTGLDVQWTLEDWLLKMEAVYRRGQEPFNDFHMVAAGLEYSFYGWLDTDADLSWLMELLYDSRDANVINPYEHDIAVGARLTLNDIRDVTFLTTGIFDLHDSSAVLNLQGSMRIDDNWVLFLKGRAFSGIPPAEFPLNGFRKDDSMEFSAQYSF